jgi:hypothetical protein
MNEPIKTPIPTNCTECHAHRVIHDPDPNDWLCDDDVAVVCTLTEGNPNCDPESHYLSEKQNSHRCITVSCRPYNTAKECSRPDWCPKLPHYDNPMHQIEENIRQTLEEIKGYTSHV